MIMKRVNRFLWLLLLLQVLNLNLSHAARNYDKLSVITDFGKLSYVLSFYNGGLDTKCLTVRGEMCGFDLSLLRSLTTLHCLRSLDISDVRIIAKGLGTGFYDVYENNTFNRGIFDDFILDQIILPKTLKTIKSGTFSDETEIDDIWLYVTDSLVVEEGAFAKSVSLIAEEQKAEGEYKGINQGWLETDVPHVDIYVPKGCIPEYDDLFEMPHRCLEYNKYRRVTEKPVITDIDGMVTISCENPKAKIYYKIADAGTVNYWAVSRNPETEYKKPFLVSKNCYIKAFAVGEGEDYSDITVYYVKPFKTPVPLMSVDSLVATSSTTVTLSHQDEDAVIYYTIDGTEPTENSTIYTGPFKVERSMTVKAAAMKETFKMSDIVSADIEIKVATPSADYNYYGSIYSMYDGIYIQCSTPYAKICYTTDGSEPTPNSADYNDYYWPLGFPGLNCILKIKAFKDGCTSSPTIVLESNRVQLPPPTISVENNVVTIENAFYEKLVTGSDKLADIYYTLDGSEPDENSILYTSPFVVSDNCVVTAIAVMENRHDSNSTFFNIDGLSYIDLNIKWIDGLVTLISPIGEAEIYYTVDGSEPDENGILYTAPFEFNGGIVKAMAVKEDGSFVKFYRLIWPQTFKVAVGDKVKLKIEGLEEFPVAFRAVQPDGGYVVPQILEVNGEWTADFLTAGTVALEAFIEDTSVGCGPVRKIFNVLPNHDILLVDGIYYRYTDGMKSALGVTYGYSQYEGNVVVPSFVNGLPIVSVGDAAFYNNLELTSITLPEGLERIESDQAFGNCPNLVKVVLPSTLTHIGSYTFNVDKGLKDIYCNMRDPSKVEIYGGEYIFNGYVDYVNCLLHVPYGCVQAYREAEVWKNFKNIVEGEKIPIPVTSIQIEQEKIVLTEGDTEMLQVTVLPDYADNRDVAWSSSDNSVVTVNEGGVVVAVAEGTATITAVAVDGSGVKATCTVEVCLLKGDSNNDGSVTVTDAVNTANYAVGKYVEVFDVKAADVNDDDIITIADASGTISIVLEQPVAERGTLEMATVRAARVIGDRLVTENYLLRSGETGVVDVTLNNLRDYVALQADIVMPDGLILEDVRLGAYAEATHTLSMRKVTDNVVRVVVFSVANKVLVDNGESLFKLYVKAENANTGDITLQRILAVDTEANEYELYYRGGHNALTSGIGGVDNGDVSIKSFSSGLHISNAKGRVVGVYHFDGSLRILLEAKEDDERLFLPSGVYIVKVGSMVTKVVIK